jgi:hypothetical protein
MRYMGFGSYGTAHSMCHKIRAALIEPEAKLGGVVEVDETWVGGKAYNKHGRRSGGGRGGAGSGKIPVIGAVSRKGNVVARVLDRVDRKSAEWFVKEMISEKVSLIATDETAHTTAWLSKAGRTRASTTKPDSMSSALFIRTRLKDSGRSSSAALLAASIRSAKNICRCT